MPEIDNLDARLAELDAHFKEAKATGGFDNQLPPPGVYQCVFREVDFFEAKATGAAYLKTVYEIVFDAHEAGRSIEMIYCLEPHKANPGAKSEEIIQKLGFLKKDLKTLGVDVEDDAFSLGTVRPGAPMWDDIIDCTVEIAVVESKKTNEQTGKPYVNAYLNARTGNALPSDATPAEAITSMVPAGNEVDDDDIPF